MKSIVVHKISDSTGLDLEEASALLAKQASEPIDTINWKEHPYCPEVSITLGYGANELYIRFDVSEKTVLAAATEDNQMVCQDSCVEFFFSPREGWYRNFEFSCIGIAYLGEGTSRFDSQKVDPTEIAKIRRKSTLGNQPFSERQTDGPWSLTLAIPFELLQIGQAVSGQKCRANFYKCGDKQSEPHYVSWNPIGCEHPDFHRPEYFGEFVFA